MYFIVYLYNTNTTPLSIMADKLFVEQVDFKGKRVIMRYAKSSKYHFSVLNYYYGINMYTYNIMSFCYNILAE